MKMKMEDNLMKWYLMEKYVDYVNWVLELLGLGVRWVREKDTLLSVHRKDQ